MESSSNATIKPNIRTTPPSSSTLSLPSLPKATGYYDDKRKEWIWDEVKWTKTEDGLYQSNRQIPPQFFNQNWQKERKRSAGVVLIRPGHNGFPDIWLVECYNSGCLGFPKGKCEKFESFRHAAEREFFEETGYKIVIPRDCPEIEIYKEKTIMVFFIVEVPRNFEIKTFPITDVEITKFGWVNLKQIYNKSIRLSATTKSVLTNKNTPTKNLLTYHNKYDNGNKTTTTTTTTTTTIASQK